MMGLEDKPASFWDEQFSGASGKISGEYLPSPKRKWSIFQLSNHFPGLCWFQGGYPSILFQIRRVRHDFSYKQILPACHLPLTDLNRRFQKKQIFVAHSWFHFSTNKSCACPITPFWRQVSASCCAENWTKCIIQRLHYLEPMATKTPEASHLKLSGWFRAFFGLICWTIPLIGQLINAY